MSGISSQPHIEFQRVEVRYSDLVSGLRGANLNVQRGEFLFLVGKTGAGKSTLLKLLTREVRETSGHVRLDGRDLADVKHSEIPLLRRTMGIVPQDFALLPRKRVWENVAYAMRAIGATKREVRHRVPEILDQVGIGHRADAYPHELSGGEQQRVAIARALITKPPLLLADEPTGNLDPELSLGIMRLLLELNRTGTTVLVATHDVLVVQELGQRVVRLESGEVIEDVPAAFVFKGPDQETMPEEEPKVPKAMSPEEDLPVTAPEEPPLPPEAPEPPDPPALSIDLPVVNSPIALPPPPTPIPPVPPVAPISIAGAVVSAYQATPDLGADEADEETPEPDPFPDPDPLPEPEPVPEPEDEPETELPPIVDEPLLEPNTVEISAISDDPIDADDPIARIEGAWIDPPKESRGVPPPAPEDAPKPPPPPMPYRDQLELDGFSEAPQPYREDRDA